MQPRARSRFRAIRCTAGDLENFGGELSHASILLREAGKPAIVNAGGIWHEVSDGDRVRLDGVKGVVEVLKEGRP